MQLYYDWNGQPISMERFAVLWCEPRHVAQTDLGPLGHVSTVWLGLDHGFSFVDGGPPVIFETMIFGGPLDQYQERYCTVQQAMNGHDFMVQALMFYRADKPKPLIHNGRKPRRHGQ